MIPSLPQLLSALALASSPAVAADCATLAPEIEASAAESGLPLPVALALVVVESRCRPVEGREPGVAGPAQVHWPTWSPLLSAEGWREDELLGPWGVLAGGRVLASLRERWAPRSTALLLCLYSDGTAALRYRRDCLYSREVLGLAARLEGR